jgi:high-affinity Fe2+/Pb2+ permease
MIKTIARHVTATVLGAFFSLITAPLVAAGVPIEAIQQFEGSAEEFVTMVLLVLFYAVFEKVLKPLFARLPGREQGETTF